MHQGTKVRDPLAIICENCGSPTSFNIYTQNYDCPACGASQGIGPSVAKVAAWRQQHYAELQRQEADIRDKVAFQHCASCGADVVYPAGEVTATCDFCGSRNLRPEFTKQRRFPEQILPFYITEEEAKERLAAWCDKHGKTPEAAAARAHLADLKGYYLPYERIRGDMSFAADVEGLGKYPYPVGGFADGVAINMSEQMDNRLLEAMEPFLWDDIRPFEFAYMADTPTKLSDASTSQAASRLDREVADIYETQVQKMLHTPNVELSLTDKNVVGLSVLLPVYYFRDGDLEIAVNGQTGRVAVTTHREKKDRTVWIAPWVLLLLILIAVGIAYKGALEALFMFGIAFGAVIFVVFSQVRKSKTDTVYLQGKPIRAVRDGGALRYEAQREAPELLSPARFFTAYGDLRLPAEIRFYRTRRFYKNATLIALALLAPLLLAFVITLVRAIFTGDFSLFGEVHWGCGIGWMALFSPVFIVLILKYGRTHLFLYPEVRYTLPNGDKVVEEANLEHGDMQVTDPWEEIKSLGCIVVPLIFLLLGLVAVMLTA